MLQKLFSKKTPNTTTKVPSVNSDQVIEGISNWYSDRYNTVVVQRNILFILVVLSIIIVVISVFMVGKVSSGFKIQPFVIELDSKTGITNVVNPFSSPELITSEVLNKYFISRYIKARESYSFESWRYNYLTVVRLLSTPSVYGGFRRFINSSPDSPLALYGKRNSTSVSFRSMQFFPPRVDKKNGKSDAQAVVRYTITADKGSVTKGSSSNTMYKIVTLTYKYAQTEMNDEDRIENPLGFYITSYRDDVESKAIPVVK